MKREYKVVLSFILFLLLLNIVIFLDYQKYLKQEEMNNTSMIEIKNNVSINYIDGKDISFQEEEKSIHFSLTNHAKESMYYDVSLINIIGDSSEVTVSLNNQSYALTDSLLTKVKFENNATDRYTLTLHNPHKKEVHFTIQISVENEDNSFASVLLNQNIVKEDPITPLFEPTKGEEGLIEEKIDHTSVYYYRGNVSNNYVNLANRLWRIVGIDANRNVKLILDGTTENMMPLNETENTSFQDSSLVNHLNLWSQTYLKDVDNEILSTLYCYDENIFLDNGSITYLPYQRIINEHSVSHTCETGISSKVALLSADEVIYAGGAINISNSNDYLAVPNLQSSWWTLTLAKKSNNTSYYMAVSKDGALLPEVAETTSLFIRPVITINHNVHVSGLGTKESPYICVN